LTRAARLAGLLPLAYLPWLAAEYWGRPLGLFDEPLLYVGARAVLHGAWPNVDFASVYPPLNYVPVALSFALFGETVLAARAAQLVAYWLLFGALAAWFRSLGARGGRLSALLLSALALTAALPIQPAVFGVVLAVLALLAYLRGLELARGGARSTLMAGAGLLAGLALLTRVSFGLYAAAAIAVDQLMELWRARRPDARAEGQGAESRADAGDVGVPGRARVVADATPLWLSGAALIGALAWAYGGHVRDIFEQSVTVLLRAIDRYAYAAPELEPSLRGFVRFFTRGWWLPLVPLAWLALRAESSRVRARWFAGAGALLAAEIGFAVAWPTALPLLLVPVVAALVGSRARERLGRGEFVALLAVGFFSHYYLSRTDLSHQLASTAALVLLLPSALRQARLLSSPPGWVLAAFALALAWPSLWSSRPGVAGVRAGLALLADARRFESDAARCASPTLSPALAAIYPDPVENAVARFVRERTREHEAVYVGVSDHASPAVSDLRLLWLIGRPLGARHYMLLGAVSNTLEAQQSIVSDLEARGVRWVVTWRPPEAEGSALARPLERGPSLVDDQLETHFREAAVFGAFTLLERAR
jgi:hypothetical protein